MSAGIPTLAPGPELITSIVTQAPINTEPPQTVVLLTSSENPISQSSLSTTAPTASPNLLGPLTTVFTQPKICSVFGNGGWEAQGCSDSYYVDDASCWPSVTIPAPSPPFNGLGYYSPGLSCPVGYTAVCSQLVAGAAATLSAPAIASFGFQYPPKENGQTAVGCCPSSFECLLFDDGRQTCFSVASSTSFLTGTCSASAFTDLNYLTLSGTGSETLLAPLFQLNFRPTDIGTISGATSSTTDGATSPSSPIPGAPLSSGSSGLTTGATVAVAVVVPVVALSILALLVVIFIRRRRRLRLDRSNVGIARENPDKAPGIAQAQEPPVGELAETGTMPEKTT